jgi:hypothetical protein
VQLQKVAPYETQNGRDAMFRRLCLNVAHWPFAPPRVCCFQFAAVAMCLATSTLQFVSLLGTSLPVTLALIAALALGFAAGSRKFAVISRASIGGFSSAALLNFVLAAWMVASPQSAEWVDAAISLPGVIRLGSPAWNAAVLFGLALGTLGLPAFIGGQLVANLAPSECGRSRLPLVFLGAAAGLFVWSAGLAQILGPYYCGLVAVGTGLALAAFEPLARGSRRAGIAEGSPICGSAGASPSDLHDIASAALLALVCGGWVAALDRLIVQLSPGSIYLGCSEIIGLCGGLAIGTFLAGRSTGPGHARKLAAVVGLALWGVGLLAAYPLLVDLSLWLNAWVSSTNLLLLGRGLCAGLAVLPVGVAAAAGFLRPRTAAGFVKNQVSHGGPNSGEFGYGANIALELLAAVAGYCAVAGAVLQQFSPDVVVIVLAWLTVATACPAAWSLRCTLLARWPARFVAAAAAFVVVIAPLWRQHFDPVRSARLLFNSHVAYAYRAGIRPSLLVALDEGRHVSTATGQRGIFTVWSYGGHQLQVRENGLPRGVISTDAEAFPRYAPETLQTVVPCLIHGKAERMLLLGLGSGEALATALSFPILEIACLETDAGLVRVVRDLTPAGKTMALDDERVTLSVCDPAIGLPAVLGTFDVVVSSPENLSLAQSQPYVTTEFYRRAARKLSSGGVFCQRLQHIDLGPRPIQAIVRAMQSVFSDVQAVEVAPGEMLLCATNDEQGLIRPGLVARLEMPQVRNALGESGYDWTVLLNIGAINNDGLREFCRTPPGPPNTASAGRLPLALPREMMRWAPKLDEMRDALGPVAKRLLDWVGDDGTSPVVVRRLAEVQGQHDLMTKYADQYWAYRASLRDQVKEQPRSAIELTSATDDEEKKMHPEDRRRVAYFTILSRAIRTRRAADIDRLSHMAWPYDPLISYFVHQEVAELYSKSPERDVAAELRHRLYATFYSSPRDSSLRNVIAGLDLLREHPECEPDPRARWDDCNALLQALKMRWEARADVRPTDMKEVIHEADRTVLAAEQMFRVLDVLTAEAGIPEELWRARRGILEKTLIAPVRSYQLNLLAIANRDSAKRDE